MVGRLEVITGPMFCGKSKELIRSLNRYSIGRKKVQAFKPVIENRYKKQGIVSHDKEEFDAYQVNSAKEIMLNLKEDIEVIGIDEAQFFDEEIIKLCLELIKKGKIVVVAGLNLDYRGEPFTFKNSEKHFGDLLVHADDIRYLNAVCTFNGKRCEIPATRTQRLTSSKEKILVGGKEVYEARCIEHHYIPK